MNQELIPNAGMEMNIEERWASTIQNEINKDVQFINSTKDKDGLIETFDTYFHTFKVMREKENEGLILSNKEQEIKRMLMDNIFVPILTKIQEIEADKWEMVN